MARTNSGHDIHHDEHAVDTPSDKRQRNNRTNQPMYLPTLKLTIKSVDFLFINSDQFIQKASQLLDVVGKPTPLNGIYMGLTHNHLYL